MNLFGQNNKLQVKEKYTFDLSNYKADSIIYLDKMQGVNADGRVMKVNNKYVEIDGTPWIPTYGEIHFSRYPEELWEEAILKMKASGMNTISSYIFWNHHEEIEGEWEWTGNKNLRKFVELCAKHDMYFFARIGPWCHGEARYGGHPDWLVERCKNGTLRSTHPDYLNAVDKLYGQIAQQLDGLYWKDGGPIYAIQLDNENWEHGPGKGIYLMDAEKELAVKHGMNVPIYTCTGWANTEFRQGEIIPSFGGYVDYFWSEAQDYYRCPSFSFSEVRVDGQIGTDMGLKQRFDVKYIDNPYFTCETGTGMHLAYHRRTKITSDDNAAVSMVKMGNGCNALGLFMFHGGRNPMGKNTRLNERLADGYNDITVFSHDWQAAIGEFGQVRSTYHKYKTQFEFYEQFGEQLAPMQPIIPLDIEADAFNSRILQRGIRTNGESGFLFVNNHIKHDTLYQFEEVQFKVKLKEEELTFPSEKINIPPHSYFIWPFNLQLDDVLLKYATVQPFTRVGNTYVFFQNKDIVSEFVFDNDGVKSIEGNNVEIKKNQDNYYVKVVEAGLQNYINLKLKNGEQLQIITLSEHQVMGAYIDNDYLYITDAESLIFKEDQIELVSENINNQLSIFHKKLLSDIPHKQEGLFTTYQIDFEKIDINADFKITQKGKKLKMPQKYVGDNVRLSEPDEKYFDQGLMADLNMDVSALDQLYDIRLNVDYKASCVRLYLNDEFVHDNYYNGDVWELSVNQLLNGKSKEQSWQVKFLPLQPDDPIYVAGTFWPDLKLKKNTLFLNSVEAKAVYSKKIKLTKSAQ
ncbi:beta-galactosidase [Flammeovirga yaeyamensis]|uniref:Beta-galactosidase n=2 Tax=Flammeovirga yaeyamensis TaxID=367791 RepID=A0AAX1N6J9_9BACT|nr:beta-galactosidase [Flammeovirga yaeyamensis]MBB3697815.1 hypothetical protein [Flammeovirga yaeyamensis]QWG03219.1 beta-galactosidase [Flammeovirga yaeyamensis]